MLKILINTPYNVKPVIKTKCNNLPFKDISFTTDKYRPTA